MPLTAPDDLPVTDDDALAAWAAITSGEELRVGLVEAGVSGDVRAVRLLQALPKTSALRLEFSRGRGEYLYQKYLGQVRAAYSKALGTFRGYIEDCIAEFRMWLAEEGAAGLPFDPARSETEGALLCTVARRRALNCFRSLNGREEKALEELSEVRRPSYDPRSQPDLEWVGQHVHRLVAGGALRPHEVIVWLAHTQLGFAASELAEARADTTFHALLEMIERSPEGLTESLTATFPILRGELALPPEAPLGARSLREAATRNRSPLKVIEDWIENVPRVCGRDLKGSSNPASLSVRAVARFRRGLIARLQFVERVVTAGTAALEGMLWSWDRMFSGAIANIAGFACRWAALEVQVRFRHAMQKRDAAPRLADLLTGDQPDETVAGVIKAKSLDPEKVIRNLEERYRRSAEAPHE